MSIASEFESFFRALWQRDPFLWQTMLAERVVSRGWPSAIKLPTASGKTACIDIALFALMKQADLLPEKRTAPRRIFLVVDRRIVVDEAFERAQKIATQLRGDGALREFAAQLLKISGFENENAPPLAAARLRGGVWCDDGWARMPTQPAIITSTVDQLGSRLLFRTYGGSDSVAPVHAALVANDSLILLDEAHCAQPFMQTLRAIENFRGDKWAAKPLQLPFHFTIMSATPPPDIEQTEIFPEPSDRAAALADEILQKRVSAPKPAELVECGESIVAEAVSRARNCVGKLGRKRVAVMVNRVKSAAEVATGLKNDSSVSAEIILLTGRMRPFDRDCLVEKWSKFLKADSPQEHERPIIMVTTQCLEVGADFTFDALITECASLDSLRQRFGRLNRLGVEGDVTAAILVSKADAKSKEADPIYGDALKRTWAWLNEVAAHESKKALPRVDFGIAAIDALVDPLEKSSQAEFRALLAPVDDAPVLLPAHLDLFSQTSPCADPEPDASLFLHGKRPVSPEISVIWRADLVSLPHEDWADAVALLPPSQGEVFRVPLHRFVQWLGEGEGTATQLVNIGDTEGETYEAEEALPRHSMRPFLIWRGADKSEVSDDPRGIKRDAVIVLPLDKKEQISIVIGSALEHGVGPRRTDIAERVFLEKSGKAVLRVHRSTLSPWKNNEAVRALLRAIAEVDEDSSTAKEKFDEFVIAVKAEPPPEPNSEPIPDWLLNLIELLGKNPTRVDLHPGGGFVITTQRSIEQRKVEEEDFFADESDALSLADEEVSLADHTRRVMDIAQIMSERCLPHDVAPLIEQCARLHDLGKLDERFQILLRNGDEPKALDALQNGKPLAKSEKVALTPSRRRAIRESAGLPKNFRHEVLSAQLANALGFLSDDENRELALHLIECHHGFARPFAPSASDGKLPAVDLTTIGIKHVFSSEERATLVPANRLDSGVAERFWKLTRRFGWWGLAYIEAMLRLADWHASCHRGKKKSGAPFADLTLSVSPKLPGYRSDFLFSAIDGGNPLGYLAALGAFRLATRAWPDRRVLLAWEKVAAMWRPLLRIEQALSVDERTAREQLINTLHQNGVELSTMFSKELLDSSVAYEKRWENKLRFPVQAYRDFCGMVVSGQGEDQQVLPEFAAVWGGETAPEENAKHELVRRTRFDFTAGQQSFIEMLRDAHTTTRAQDLEAALFSGWRYQTSASSMRWDPVDEKRQYAIQASDPTNAAANPSFADPGANFLAIEALPLFPFIPDRLASQPGFERDARSRSWTWVLWREPATLDVVRALIATVSSKERNDADGSQPLVCARFRSAIVMPSGRYRCFTRPRAI